MSFAPSIKSVLNQYLYEYIRSHPGYNLRNIVHVNRDKYETADFCDEFYKFLADKGVEKDDKIFVSWRDEFFSEMKGAI